MYDNRSDSHAIGGLREKAYSFMRRQESSAELRSLHKTAHKERKGAVKKQTRKRLIYQNWMVNVGKTTGLSAGDVISPEKEKDEQGERRGLLVEKAVRAALGSLPEEERELLERYYYMGESLQSMAERTGRKIHKIEAMHRRAVRGLKKELSGFANSVLNLPAEEFPSCPVCHSDNRLDIDRIIKGKRPEMIWREVIKTIKERFGVVIRTPQTLIGHQKYHSKIPSWEKTNKKEKSCR